MLFITLRSKTLWLWLMEIRCTSRACKILLLLTSKTFFIQTLVTLAQLTLQVHNMRSGLLASAKIRKLWLPLRFSETRSLKVGRLQCVKLRFGRETRMEYSPICWFNLYINQWKKSKTQTKELSNSSATLDSF